MNTRVTFYLGALLTGLLCLTSPALAVEAAWPDVAFDLGQMTLTLDPADEPDAVFVPGDYCRGLLLLTGAELRAMVSPRNRQFFSDFCQLGANENCQDYDPLIEPSVGHFRPAESLGFCQFIPAQGETP